MRKPLSLPAIAVGLGSLAAPATLAGDPDLYLIPTWVSIDNTFRVPQGAGFDPAEWRTVEFFISGANCSVTGLQFNIANVPTYQSPGGSASPFPLPVSGYDDNPLSRYDSALRLPTVNPSNTLLVGSFNWTATSINGFMSIAVPVEPPALNGARSIGRLTIPAQGNVFSYFFNTIEGITCFCGLGGATSPLSVLLIPNYSISMTMREINDQHDEFMDLELTFQDFVNDPKFVPQVPVDLFIPASRVVSASMLAAPAGWSVQKVYREGEFGLRLRSSEPVPSAQPVVVVLRATLADAGITRDVRYPDTLSDFAVYAPSFGYWAPVADSLLAGDTNDDDVVDFTDLNNILIDFGGPASSWRTDFDASGTVDFGDLNAVLAAFGTSG